MYAKLRITGKIEVLTGMHIGGSGAFAAIGAVDSPVIKDVRTNLPMIPGSSLKGKMRTLLAKQFNETVAGKPDDDCERIIRLFGAAKKGKNNKIPKSRILISDMFMLNDRELREKGLQSVTEIKFENTINRVTAVANPRQIERAVKGSEYNLDIMYEVENLEQLKEDIETLGMGMRLVQYDYIGGNGSRGYGKIRFKDIEVKPVVGEISVEIVKKCADYLQKSVED